MKQQRNTKQKKLILDTVLSRHDHPTADDIYIDVRTIDNKISRGTVYRNLNLLAEENKISKVKFSDSDRYDCRDDKHYHLRCQCCGKIEDAPMKYDASLDEMLAKMTDFIPEKHEVTFLGVCKDCQSKT